MEVSNLFKVKNKVVYKGTEYPSLEHGYKCLKAVYHDRSDLVPKIMSIESPMEMMRMVDRELGKYECQAWFDKREG